MELRILRWDLGCFLHIYSQKEVRLVHHLGLHVAITGRPLSEHSLRRLFYHTDVWAVKDKGAFGSKAPL